MKKIFILIITIALSIILVSCSVINSVATKKAVKPTVTESAKVKNTVSPTPSISANASIAPVSNNQIISFNQKEPLNPNAYKGNIKIIPKTLNIRAERDSKSEILSKAIKDEVYTVLNELLDSDGKTWYEINAKFGVTGWVAGWLCEKTKEKSNNRIISEPGELIHDDGNSALFIELLLLNDYSIKNIIKKYGDDYEVEEDRAISKYYLFKNGIKLDMRENHVKEIFLKDRSFQPDSTLVKKTDLFKSNGTETFVFYKENYDYNLIVLDNIEESVIREYATFDNYVSKFEIESYLNNGESQMFIDGTHLKGIYSVEGNEINKLFIEDSFNLLKKGIKTKILSNRFELDINFKNYSSYCTAILPDRMFFNNKSIKDKNTLVVKEIEWNPIKINNKWTIKANIYANYKMTKYYFGPPILYGDKEYTYDLLSDLAIIDFNIKLNKDNYDIERIDLKTKHDGIDRSIIKPMFTEEACFKNGPSLGMTLVQAVKSLGLDPKKYKNKDSVIFNGIEAYELFGVICDLFVDKNTYTTIRGLKVGDSIERVEELYGKPDIGFSGDKTVEYKFCEKDDNNKVKINYYRFMNIGYKNNKVKWIGFHQIVLD